jgi:hypothetical protein
MEKWKVVEERVEVSGLSFEGVGEVEGFKLFSKIKGFMKKVGKGVKKLTFKKILGVAVPLVGLGLLPVAGLPLAGLIKKFGKSAAGKMKLGKTVVKAVKGSKGAKSKIALITPAAAAKLLAMGVKLNQEATAEQIAMATGEPIDASIVAGDIQAGAAIIENLDTAKEIVTEKKALIAGMGITTAAIIGGLAIWGLKKKRGRQ